MRRSSVAGVAFAVIVAGLAGGLVALPWMSGLRDAGGMPVFPARLLDALGLGWLFGLWLALVVCMVFLILRVAEGFAAAEARPETPPATLPSAAAAASHHGERWDPEAAHHESAGHADR